MKSIDSQYLIDPRFTSVTDQALSKDQVIDIYLHNFHGATSVSGGPYGSQIIGALAWNDDDIDFAQSLIDDLDHRLGIDFAQNLISNRYEPCLLYTSPSPRDMRRSRMPSSA